MARLVLTLLLVLTGCATGPRSPAQQRLDTCLRQADRDIIESASVEPGGRYSYRAWTSGGSNSEIEKFRACMEGRAPAYPTVR